MGYRGEAAQKQLPHPGHQIHRLTRGQHHRGDEPGERRHHHQHRQHRLLTEPDRDLGRREPQVALDHPTGRMLEPVDRVCGQVLRADARTRSRNQEIEPVQPTRWAITVAGICGYVDNNARIRGSTALIAEATGSPWYFGGPSLATAAATVSRAMPSCRAIARCDKPSLR